MSISTAGVPSSAQPFARAITSQLDSLQSDVDMLKAAANDASQVDRTVSVYVNQAQTIAASTHGAFDPQNAVAVHYVSSTGLYEVTVGMSGLVAYGGKLGASFYGQGFAQAISNDIPLYGVAFGIGDSQASWVPFSVSNSTIQSGRAGAIDISAYVYANLSTTNSQAYVQDIWLTVKAV